MPPENNNNTLLELVENNGFFDMIVDMIPSKIYLAGRNVDGGGTIEGKNKTQQQQQQQQSGERPQTTGSSNSKYFKNNYNNNKKNTEMSKEARKAAAKLAKRQRLDPAASVGTVQSIAQLEQEMSRPNDTHNGRAGLLPTSATPSLSATTKTTTASQLPSSSASPAEPSSDTNNHLSSRIEALRLKLLAKIAQKSKESNRPADSSTSKRAKRVAEKLKRREEAMKRTKAGGGTSESSSNVSAKASQSSSPAGDPTSSVPEAKYDLMNIDFGRLAGLNPKAGGIEENYAESNKALANLKKPKNLQKILAQAQAKKALLEQCKRSDDAADHEKAKSIQWTDALREAGGTRVKDDPAKIKKALARRAAKKSKSQKAWQTRIKQQQAQKDERQAIRQHNLNARRQGGAIGANLSSKRIVAPPDSADQSRSRQRRPGFEGRKQGFVNTGGRAAGAATPKH